MKVAIAAVATLAVAVNARNVPYPKPMPCPTTPVPEPTSTEIESITETATPVDIPAVCSNLPKCLDGVMVPGHAYSVQPALWECAKHPNCDSMKIWCEPKKHIKSAEDAFDFWYACEEIPAVPEDTTCKINDKKYTVGVAYEDVKVDGEKFDYVWCLDSETIVSCSGDDCGSTVELTPPGIEVVEKCLAPVVPRPDECWDCKTCTYFGYVWFAGRCAEACPMDVPCFTTPAQCRRPIYPTTETLYPTTTETLYPTTTTTETETTTTTEVSTSTTTETVAVTPNACVACLTQEGTFFYDPVSNACYDETSVPQDIETIGDITAC